MANKSLEELNVQPGDKVVITGTVAFSELATRVEGEKLQQKIKRQEERGFKFPETKPHYSVSLVDVEVADDYKGTPLATYYGQQVYKNKDGKHAITLVSKSPFAPNVYHKIDGGKAEQIELPSELAPGQKVEVLIDCYKPKQYNKLGSSFTAIMLPEGDVSYYSKGASSEIEAFGVKPAQTVSAKKVEESNDAPAEFASTNASEFPATPADAQPEPATSASASNDSGIVNNPFG